MFFSYWLMVVTQLFANYPALANSSNPRLISPIYKQQEMPHHQLKKDVYIYQNQTNQEVSWLYGGMAPRVEDPNRIQVVISKQGYTMRVTLLMTASEVAKYPGYLVQRSFEIAKVMQENGIQVYPDNRNQQMFELYLSRVQKIAQDHIYFSNSGFSLEKYEKGLNLLKEYFPGNIFELKALDALGGDFQNQIVVAAHFVYPITTHVSGVLPRAGAYIQSHHFGKAEYAVQERRSYYSKDPESHIFGGFPAFWFSTVGSGIGVHGPIRFTDIYSSNSVHGSGPSAMRKFWLENEFIKNPLLSPFDLSALNQMHTRMRWDLVRTNQSKGCFRAETLELRHLLPTSREVIFNEIKWQIQDQIDQVFNPELNTYQLVDVNYYLMNPSQKPLSRKNWIADRILRNQKLSKADREQRVQDFIDSSYLFEYLDPSSIEIIIPESNRARGQGHLNRATSPNIIEL